MAPLKAPRPGAAESLIGVLVAGLGTATLAGFLGGLAWWLDLFSHFHLHLAVAGGLVATLALAMRRLRWAVLCGALIAANLVPVAPVLNGGGAVAAPAGRAVSIASYNVKYDNPNPPKALAFVRRTEADIVVLSEFRPEWRPLLGQFADRYPYRYIAPAHAWKGIERSLVLLSRWPFRRVEAVSAEPGERTLALRAVIGDVTLFGAHLSHPLPPSSPARAAAERATLADLVARTEGPVAVVGDLNMTPYSAAWRRFVAASGLRRAQAGIAGSYLVGWGPLAMPIDHLLIGGGLAGGFRVEEAPGSDHLLLRGWIVRDAPARDPGEDAAP